MSNQHDNQQIPPNWSEKEPGQDPRQGPVKGPGQGPDLGGQQMPQRRPNSSSIIILMVVGFIILLILMQSTSGKYSEITYGFFKQQLKDDNVEKVHVEGTVITGKFKKPPKNPDAQNIPGAAENYKEDFRTEMPILINEKLDEMLQDKLGKNYSASSPSDNTGMLMMVYLMVTIFLFVAVYFFFRRAREQMMGGGMMAGFGKSPARRYSSEKRTTFDDVAGLESVKGELQEIVQYLRDPKRYERLGGRVPKGFLLVGAPGTGKTLLARAVAGEAEVPYFSINGSEFIQMFVGVGASRVRDMFNTAKEHQPAILFIDEIDAIGRHRGTGVGGGSDEREQTLNQILSEMDGFQQNESLIVIAATNRPDILDPALLRPGRFDRHITVDRPTRKGRVELFKVHTRKIPLGDDVDLDRLASATIGMTGADISNIANEAALWASRHDKEKVEMEDFEYARDKVLMGLPRDDVVSDQEKRMVAFHEAGHALMMWLVPEQDERRLHKVTIVPRGQALGMTMMLPDEDRFSVSETNVRCRLLIDLGGRTAEKIVYGEYYAGSAQDLRSATDMARRMVTHWGMSQRIGPIALPDGEEHPFLGREIAMPRQYSEHTARVIDEEVSRILHEISQQATELLEQNRDKLDTLALALLEEETLEDDRIEELIGPPAYKANLPKKEEEGEDKNDDASDSDQGDQASEDDTDNEKNSEE